MKATRKHTRKRRRLRIDLARHGMANKIIRTRVSDATVTRLIAACKTARLPAEDVIRAGVMSILREIETFGEAAVSTANAPVLNLTEKTRRRMAEVDFVLGIETDGVAETVLFRLVEDMMGGAFDIVTDGWHWNDPEEIRANLRCVADRWASEDTLA